jgi:penicillin-binding protein 1C
VVTGTESLPASLRTFTRKATAPETSQVAQLPPPSIAFPPNGAVVPLPAAKTKEAALQLKAEGGRMPLTWLVNGAPLGSFDRFAPAFYTPQGEGVAKVTVVDADGRSDSSTVRFAHMH